MRHIAANALTLLILCLLMVAVSIGWGREQYTTAGPLDQAICLKVDSGSSMPKVAKKLEDQGAIRSGFIFRTGVNYADKTQDLKAGAFIVPAGASMEEIAGIITGSGLSNCGTEVIFAIGVNSATYRVRDIDPDTGRFAETARFGFGDEVPDAYTNAREDRGTRYRVSFAEGATSWQVATSLAQIDFLDGAADGIPDEGSLAPDSYEVTPGSSVDSVIARMQEAQASVLEEAWLRRDPETPLKSREEALILASIVEKETGQAEERPLVASVFINRLNKKMLLQTDPTVIYGITKGEGVLGRGLRRSELDRATPYNTYRIKGLPPTPIANPGRAAIEATLNPDDSKYIFFVADGTGGHAFAETLEEHNRNVRVWREIERQRANSNN